MSGLKERRTYLRRDVKTLFTPNFCLASTEKDRSATLGPGTTIPMSGLGKSFDNISAHPLLAKFLLY